MNINRLEGAFRTAQDAHAQTVLDEVGSELSRALDRYPDMNSSHEGYAVILEELDELWDEVKKKPSERSKALMRGEAIQVAAMAVRFIVDICDEGDAS